LKWRRQAFYIDPFARRSTLRGVAAGLGEVGDSRRFLAVFGGFWRAAGGLEGVLEVREIRMDSEIRIW
jgi:hypothetical protein